MFTREFGRSVWIRQQLLVACGCRCPKDGVMDISPCVGCVACVAARPYFGVCLPVSTVGTKVVACRLPQLFFPGGVIQMVRVQYLMVFLPNDRPVYPVQCFSFVICPSTNLTFVVCCQTRGSAGGQVANSGESGNDGVGNVNGNGGLRRSKRRRVARNRECQFLSLQFCTVLPNMLV